MVPDGHLGRNNLKFPRFQPLIANHPLASTPLRRGVIAVGVAHANPKHRVPVLKQ